MNTFFEKITGASSKATSSDFEEIAEEEDEERKPTFVSKPAVAAKNNTQFIQRTVPREHSQVKTAGSAPPPEEQGDGEEGELTVDIYDGGNAIVIQSTVAGVKPEDLDVSLTNDSITIHGRRQRPDDIHDDNYYYKELFWGTFSRSIILPEEIEEGEAEATVRHGLLTVKLPKKKRGVVQKLKVRTA